jgi:hypothetical protein
VHVGGVLSRDAIVGLVNLHVAGQHTLKRKRPC